MKKLINIYILFSLVLSTMISCKKDPIIDGGVHKAEVNMTTYDYLKSHPRAIFDTTLLIIDKAGMKDLINSSGTFFVPTDFAIANYIAIRQTQVRKVNEKANYTLDTLFKYFSPAMLKDSIGMYFFADRIEREGLNELGKNYVNAVGTTYNVSLDEHHNNDYNGGGIITARPKFLYLNRIIGERDIVVNGQVQDPSGKTSLRDVKVVCQTSGIISTTGVIHVLTNGHSWIQDYRINVN